MELIQNKIILITTGQPSTNPRLVKEANALSDAGYEVKVYYQFWTEWAYESDKVLLKEVKWEYKLTGGDPYQQSFIFFLNKMKFKIFQFLVKHTNLFLNRYKYRAYSNIVKQLKKDKADHYIAHNLGALTIAAKAAQYHQVSYSFDAEDFHRGQYKHPCREQEIDIILENKYIPYAKFITTASPLITEKYSSLFPGQKFTTINNVFPKNEFQQEISLNLDKPLKLVWFSQTIGTKRGLEELLNAFNLINDFSLELNLIGHYSQETQDFLETLLIEKRHTVHFIKPMIYKELNTKLSDFDIGIASETGRDINNNIALSNKIFSYIQAGLAILASQTSAQQLLFKEYPKIGALVDISKPAEISRQLRAWHNEREVLHITKRNSLKTAETLNWDTEKQIFLNLFDG